MHCCVAMGLRTNYKERIKKDMKPIKLVLKLSLLCLLLPLFVGCNEEDDIEGIFIERTWYVTSFLDAEGKPENINDQELANNPANYRIVFTPETFNAQAGTYVFSGRWTVDGKNQSIHFTMDSGTSGTSELSRALIDRLEKAVRYEGSYTYLRLYTEAGNSVLFSPGD